MNDQIQLIEIPENNNVEVCVGHDIVHTASTFAAAVAWLSQARGTTVKSHNQGGDVYINPIRESRAL